MEAIHTKTICIKGPGTRTEKLLFTFNRELLDTREEKLTYTISRNFQTIELANCEEAPSLRYKKIFHTSTGEFYFTVQAFLDKQWETSNKEKTLSIHTATHPHNHCKVNTPTYLKGYRDIFAQVLETRTKAMKGRVPYT
jgi:hypothetical protein